MRLCAVYQIIAKDGRAYIGSTNNYRRRSRSHFSHLRNGRHQNRYLQRLYDKHGPRYLSIKVMLVCRLVDLRFYEQRAIDALKPELNLTQSATGMFGFRHREETKVKLRAQRHTEEAKKKMRGRTISEETRQRLRLSHIGKTLAPDAIAKRNLAIKKAYENPAVRTRVSEGTRAGLAKLKTKR